MWQREIKVAGGIKVANQLTFKQDNYLWSLHVGLMSSQVSLKVEDRDREDVSTEAKSE